MVRWEVVRWEVEWTRRCISSDGGVVGKREEGEQWTYTDAG